MLNELIEVVSDPGVIAVGAIGSILTLFVMAATNRVCVFESKADFVWTALIGLVPLIWLMSLGMTRGGEGMPATLPSYDWASIRAQPGRSAYMVLGVILFAIGVLNSLRSSIGNNGLIVGVILFAFKLFASAFLILMIPATIYLNAIIDENRPRNSSIFYLIMAGFGYLTYLLINGERVWDRREALAESA